MRLNPNIEISVKIYKPDIHTAKIPYGEISARQKVRTAKNPYGENSYCENSYGEKSYGKNS